MGPVERMVRPLCTVALTAFLAYSCAQMINALLLRKRLLRYLRLWLRDAIAETAAPLTDTNSRLNFIAVLVLVYFLAPKRNPDAQILSVISNLQTLETLLYSVPIFFALNLIFAVFRVRKKECELGEWFGSRFIYHQPRRLFTVLVDERDNGNPFSFSVDDAEDGSLVSYAIETDRTDRRATVELAWPGGQRPMDFGRPMNMPKGSFRLPPSREMSLLSHVEPQSTLTTVRVFMTGWEIGKGDGRG